MKILFILPEYYPHAGGGISTYYINYIKALQPKCTRLKVIVGSGYYNSPNKLNIDGVEVEGLEPDRYRSMLPKFSAFDITPELKNNIAAAWAMYEQANKGEGFDIIECTDFALGFIPWMINHSKPVITRLHGSMGQISLHEKTTSSGIISSTFLKQTELLLLSLCDGLLTYSSANAKYWNNLLDTTRVVKIDPVFSVETPTPFALNQRENYGLVTARVQRWKGAVELCKATDLLEDNTRPKIKWVGRDMPYSFDQTTSQYLSATFPSIWGKSLIAEGPAENSQVRQLQCKAKFGVVASTWDMYNFTCLEFLASGTPVICSDGAGVVDIIEHGKNGLRYPANDVNALSACLKMLNEIGDEEYTAMCFSALKSIEKLSAENLIHQNIEQYEKVMTCFKPGVANEYLTSIYTPQHVQYDIDELLDKQPLKKLSGYVLKRLTKKISGKK